MVNFVVLDILTVFLTLLALPCRANKNFTVTTEATLEFEVKNYNSQGDDVSHKVVIGLFGDTAPITSLNFKTLCNGWTRNDVSIKNRLILRRLLYSLCRQMKCYIANENKAHLYISLEISH